MRFVLLFLCLHTLNLDLAMMFFKNILHNRHAQTCAVRVVFRHERFYKRLQAKVLDADFLAKGEEKLDKSFLSEFIEGLIWKQCLPPPKYIRIS